MVKYEAYTSNPMVSAPFEIYCGGIQKQYNEHFVTFQILMDLTIYLK